MNQNREALRRELDGITPSPARLDALVDRMEAEVRTPAPRRAGRRAIVAVAVCAALLVTAVAAGPTIWDMLKAQLGPFAPYAGEVEADTAVDQGIEVKALSAMSDGTYARIYLSIRDLEGDRLSGNLKTDVVFKAESSEEPLPGQTVTSYGFGREFLSYDPATKTALFELSGMDIDTSQPMAVLIGRMTTNDYDLEGIVSLEGVGTEPLACEEVGEDAVIWRPGDLQGAPEEDAALRLPARPVALEAGQNARNIEGTELFRVSSVGFATDGYLHVRVDVDPSLTMDSNGALIAEASATREYEGYMPRFVLRVEGGIDIVLPHVTAEEFAQYGYLHIYGSYKTPGEPIEGTWEVPVQFEVMEPTLLSWTGEAAEGKEIREVWISPITAVLEISGPGFFSEEKVVAHMADGSTVSSHFVNGSVREDEQGVRQNHLRWVFDAPVELEDVEYLTYWDAVIPAG